MAHVTPILAVRTLCDYTGPDIFSHSLHHTASMRQTGKTEQTPSLWHSSFSPKHQGIGKNYLLAGNTAGVALGSLQENTWSAKDYFLLTLFFSKKEASFLHPKMLLLLSDYRIHRREKDSCKTVESGGYLERTRHIRTFISEINQPSNY